jgi:hypothetical protein
MAPPQPRNASLARDADGNKVEGRPRRLLRIWLTPKLISPLCGFAFLFVDKAAVDDGRTRPSLRVMGHPVSKADVTQ